MKFDTEQLNQIPPSEHEAHGLLTKSECGEKKENHGYCCVYCGSGTGPNRSGALNFDYKDGIWKHKCQVCGEGGDNIKFFQQVFSADFQEACKRASEMYHVPYLDGSAPSTKKLATTGTTKPTNRYKLPVQKNAPEQIQLIKDDIKAARDNLINLPWTVRDDSGLKPVRIYRGLDYDTWKRFGCGYLDRWEHPANRLKGDDRKKILSRRIIIPTADGIHYNACMLDADRTEGTKKTKMHAGSELQVFNVNDLKAPTVIVTEGEIDAMSLSQAREKSFAAGVLNGVSSCPEGFVATLAAKGWKSLIIPQIDAGLITKRNFIIIYDNDETGTTQAAEFKKALLERNFPVVVKFLADYLTDDERKKFSGKVDANDLIQYSEDRLREIISQIIADSQKDFDDFQNQAAPRQERADSMNTFKSGQAGGKLAELMTTREVAEFLNVSRKTVEHWRQRKLFGCYFFTPDEKRGDTLYYYRERVEQLKAVYQKGILQNMYKLARKNPEPYAPRLFSENFSNLLHEELSLRHKEFMILDEVADFFGVDKSTVSRWHEKGILKEDMLGHNGDLYFAIDNVLDFTPPSKKFDDDIQAKLDAWQAANGDICAEHLDKINDAKSFIDALTVETFTPSLPFDFKTREFVALCQLYLPDYARKFFDILKTARAVAADKIKELAKQNADISDETKSLANIVPSEIKKEINSLVSSLRQKNKQAAKDSKLAAANAQQKALETSNENLSTKKIFSDCPIDLNLPPGVYMSQESGLRRIDWDRPVGLQGRPVIGVSSTPIVPTKIFREPEKHLTQYEVAIKTGKVWRRVVVDGRTLIDPKKILELADFGALIKHPSHLAKYFAEIISFPANSDRIPQIKFYQQPGWHGGKFIYPAGGDDYIVRRPGFDYDEIFSKSGDSELWKNTFRRVTESSPIVRIFIGFALAAPLVRPLNILNPQIHLSAPNDSGKSGLMKFAASIFGNPSEMLKTFAATPKNSISVAAASNDLPSFFDELETLKKAKEDTLSQMVYEFAQGIANQANKRDGTPRPTVRFKGSKLSTAERPLLKSHDQRGAFKRLVQIDTRSALFDDPSLTAELHFISENNFGHFGQSWINFVAAHITEIKSKYMECNMILAAKPNKRETEPTLFKSATVAALALRYFMVCLGFDSEFDDFQFARDLNDINNILPTPRELDDSTRALADLQSFIAGHDRFFSHETVDKPEIDNEYAQSAFECYGKTFNNGEIAFLPTALKKILENELGFASADALITEWASKGLLRCSKGSGNRFTTRINGQLIKAYRFKAGVLLDDNQDEYD